MTAQIKVPLLRRWFGKFGALDVEEDWDDEARRYFIGIVGKYGAQVQRLLKVAATLDIQIVCPLHGPVLTRIWVIISDFMIHGLPTHQRKRVSLLPTLLYMDIPKQQSTSLLRN